MGTVPAVGMHLVSFCKGGMQSASWQILGSRRKTRRLAAELVRCTPPPSSTVRGRDVVWIVQKRRGIFSQEPCLEWLLSI